MEIAPSILSADFANLENEIKKIEEAELKYVHVDVMDGNFVQNISIGQPVVKSIRSVTDLILDVHLMVEEPLRYIKDFADAGSDIITVHQEACVHLDKTLSEIKHFGKKAGVTINPATPVSLLENVLHMVDLVLIMSVNPGFGGQKFIENSLEKIRLLKNIRKEKRLNYLIELDGGVNKNNISEIIKNGADIIVAGSSVFNDNATVKENVNLLKKASLGAIGERI